MNKNDEKEEDKWWKKQKGQRQKKQEVRIEEGFTQEWSRREKMTEAIFERGTERFYLEDIWRK